MKSAKMILVGAVTAITILLACCGYLMVNRPAETYGRE